MTHCTRHFPFPRSPVRALTMRVLALFLLLTLLPTSASVASAQVVPNVLSLNANLVANPGGWVIVHGEGFTPGGVVYIAITSHNSQVVLVDSWTTASAYTYAKNGSSDPSQASVEEGTFTKAISPAGETVYGTNGSRDPAQGYLSTSGSAFMLCGQDVDVLAFDATSHSWSSRIEFVGACQDEPDTAAPGAPACLDRDTCRLPS